MARMRWVPLLWLLVLVVHAETEVQVMDEVEVGRDSTLGAEDSHTLGEDPDFLTQLGDTLESGESDGLPADSVTSSATKAEKAKAEKQSENTAQLQPNYSEADIRQIAVARTTPIANSFNGSLANISKAGKTEAMVTEYMESTRQQAADKDTARVTGNNASKAYSLKWNKVLKDREERLYKMRLQVTNTSLTAYREKWNTDVAAIRMAHAAACKNLTANNPYPKNSSQYKQVTVACKMESSKNLNNATVMPKGSHDTFNRPGNHAYGPWGGNSTDVTEVKDVESKLATQAAKPKTETRKEREQRKKELRELDMLLELQMRRDSYEEAEEAARESG